MVEQETRIIAKKNRAWDRFIRWTRMTDLRRREACNF